MPILTATASNHSFYANAFLLFLVMIRVCIYAGVIYLFVMLIKALRKYLKSEPVRKESAAVRRSLGEALKAHRAQCKMTQEFVAEHLGVSRQAVSKWETGQSDPSTSNLLALARLYGISPEALLKEIQEESP